MQLVLNKCLLERIFFSQTELSPQDVTLNEPARLKVFFFNSLSCFLFLFSFGYVCGSVHLNVVFMEARSFGVFFLITHQIFFSPLSKAGMA